MEKVKLDEVKGLLELGTIEEALRKYITADSNVLNKRILLDIKYTSDGAYRFKGHLIVGGHHRKLIELMGHSCRTL